MKSITSQIVKHYPNALSGPEVTEKYLHFLRDEYRVNLARVLFATSLCCDDVNISTDFRRVLTRPFALGGLGGLPYSGFTGMTAYAHHIPDGGEAFIFYGPHIGITDSGELGRMLRPGQYHLTNSCGALMLALERMKDSGNVHQSHNLEYDQQQFILERTLIPYKKRILQAENLQKEITEAAYTEIHKKLHTLVDLTKNEFRCKRILLLGGIIINTSPYHKDFVDIRNFDVIQTGTHLSNSAIDLHAILETKAFRAL